jgi:hypothetical protein
MAAMARLAIATAALLLSIAAPAAASPTKMYAGSTSRGGWPITVETRGMRLARIGAAYDTRCFAYFGALGRSDLRAAGPGRGGRFSFSVTTSVRNAPEVWWNRAVRPVRHVEGVSGGLTARSVRGTVRATLSFVDGSTCTTGPRRFTARHRPGRVFGGRTSQSAPVVVELDAAATRIRRVLFGWVAPCRDGGELVGSETLTALQLTAGNASTVYEYGYVNEAGGVDLFIYLLSADLGTSLTGTLAATVTSTDSDGAESSRCETARVRWTARS